MVICVGEILSDMIAKERNGNICFERYAGGAPFNVACGIAKLGGESGFYGCVGQDIIGDYLVDFAKQQALSYCNIERSVGYNTTLAFVELNEDGERNFSFYRKNTADYRLNEDVIPEILEKADIIHLGSLPLSEECGRNFYDKLIFQCKERNKKISFDVNYRDDIFSDDNTAKEIYSKYIDAADIVKLSQEELKLFTDQDDVQRGIERIVGCSDKAVFVTLGKDGSAYLHNGVFGRVEAVPVQVIDTTGAGDAFFAGVLYELDRCGFANYNGALQTGSICGSLTTKKNGAIDAFPTSEEVKKLKHL